MSIVFFDLETGGLEPTHPDIQLAAVALDGEWNELESFDGSTDSLSGWAAFH